MFGNILIDKFRCYMPAQDIDISPKIVKSELERQRKLIIPALKDILKDYSCEIGNKILKYIQSVL